MTDFYFLYVLIESIFISPQDDLVGFIFNMMYMHTSHDASSLPMSTLRFLISTKSKTRLSYFERLLSSLLKERERLL